MNYLQIAALGYVFFYYGFLLVFRAFLLYKKTGVNPVKVVNKEGIIGFIEQVFLVCFILVSVIAFNFAFLPENYVFYLVPIPYLEIPLIANIGIVLSFFGLIMSFIAQLQMGNSWRLGISSTEKTDLVTKGFYQYSRNPIYLGLFISYLGFFLLMPNSWSLCFFVMSYIAIEVKISHEEEHMEKLHSKAFLAYKQKVRKWI